MAIFVGLDIGGTKLLAEAADTDGRTLKRVRAATPLGLADGLGLIDAMIADATESQAIAAIGVAVGGPLDKRHGIVSPLHQPEWRNVPLRQILEDRHRCPVEIDVDTNVAAIGEYKFGGHPDPRLLYVTISTGIGGGFLIDGGVYSGAAGVHPEIGHQSIPFRCGNPKRVRCECGSRDCLEALVSGNGIRRIYGKPAEELDQAEWREVGYNVGQGLRNAAVIYLPGVIVLGGGVAVGGGDQLLALIREVLHETVRLVPIPEVRISALGGFTAVRGAVAMALDLAGQIIQ